MNTVKIENQYNAEALMVMMRYGVSTIQEALDIEYRRGYKDGEKGEKEWDFGPMISPSA